MRIGKIEFRWGEANQCHELVCWATEATCHVIAFFERTREGYDMRTVGERYFMGDEHAELVASYAMRFLTGTHHLDPDLVR